MSDLSLSERLQELRDAIVSAPSRSGRRNGNVAVDYDDLPTELDDPRLGLERKKAAVVAAVLSQALGTRAPDGPFVNQANWMCALYGTTPTVIDGAAHDAPHPDIDAAGPWPGGDRAWKSLDLDDKNALKDLYELSVATYGAKFHFPVELLCRYFPTVLWPVIWTMLCDGPDVANGKLTYLLVADGGRLLPARKDLAERKPSKESREKYRDSFRGLMASAAALNSRGHKAKVFQEWFRLPPRPKVDGAEADTDTEGVPLVLKRKRWREFDKQVREALRCLPGESESKALARLPISSLFDDGVFTLLRDRLIYHIVSVFYVRPIVFEFLHGVDYDPRSLYQGKYRPALGIRGHKGSPEEQRAWKVMLVRDCAIPFDTWLQFLDRLYAAPQAKKWNLPRAPHRMPKSPLVFARPSRPFDFLAGGTIVRLFSGNRGTSGSPTEPFVSKHPDATGPERFDGYKAGQHRHNGFQTVEELGRPYLIELKKGWDPKVLAEALGDHSEITGDPMGYYDQNKSRGRKHLSAHAVKLSYEAVATDRGAPHGPDKDRFIELLGRRTVLRDEIRILRDDIAALKERREGGEVSLDLLTDFTTTYGDLDDLRDGVLKVEIAMERLKNPRNHIALPDDVSEADQFVNLDELERSASAVEALDLPCPKFARRWWGPREFAVEVLAPLKGEATFKRWVLGKLPHPPGDPRNPFPHEAIPLTDGTGPLRRRLWADGLLIEFLRLLPPEKLDHAIYLLTTPKPAGWSDDDCKEMEPPEFIQIGAFEQAVAAIQRERRMAE